MLSFKIASGNDSTIPGKLIWKYQGRTCVGEIIDRWNWYVIQIFIVGQESLIL